MLQVVHKRSNGTHQDSAGGRLTGDKFASPVLRLGHKRALELLLALPSRLLFLLFRIVWRKFGLLSTTEKRKGSPQQDDSEASKEGEYARQEETPPFPDLQTVIYWWRHRRSDITVRHDDAIILFSRMIVVKVFGKTLIVLAEASSTHCLLSSLVHC
jgi:hypothetical protein